MISPTQRIDCAHRFLWLNVHILARDDLQVFGSDDIARGCQLAAVAILQGAGEEVSYLRDLLEDLGGGCQSMLDDLLVVGPADEELPFLAALQSCRQACGEIAEALRRKPGRSQAKKKKQRGQRAKCLH